MTRSTFNKLWWGIWATIVAAGLGMIGITAGQIASGQATPAVPTTQLVIPPSTQPTTVTISTTITITGAPLPGTPVVQGPATQPSTQPATQPAPVKMAMGVNLAANDPWQTDAPWADVAHRMTGWFQGSTDPALKYDAQGYPQGPAWSQCWLYGYPAGKYHLHFAAASSDVLAVSGKGFENLRTVAPNTFEADVTFASGEFCRFRVTGPVSDVHLYAPDAVSGQTFRPAFLAALKPFKVVRTMPWTRPNADMPRPDMNKPVDLATNKPAWPISWGMRNLPGSYDQTSKEVALEYQFQLAKESGCTLWLNTYWGEDDDSLTRKAQLAASYNLPGLIVEPMGNEPWNTGGGYQGNDIRKAGQAAGFPGDINQAGAKYAAAQGAHVAAIFRSILGNKVKVVFSGQAVWGAWMSDGLSSVPAGTYDAGVVAPYFQSVTALTAASTPADIEAGCSAWISGPLATGLAQNWSACSANGSALWAYEGGPHLLPVTAVSGVPMQDTPQAQATFAADPITAFQLDPAMGRCCDQLFAVSAANHVSEFTYFYLVGYWGRSGYWGAKQFLTDPDGPKGQAIQRAIAAGN